MSRTQFKLKKAKYAAMTSTQLFALGMKGKMTKMQAMAAAEVIEERFPTPKKILNKYLQGGI